MMHVNQQRVLPFCSEQLKELVCDINSYKHFIPYCYDSNIEKTYPDGSVTACLVIKFGPFMKSFSTTNSFDESGEKLTISHHSGPFKSLEGYWFFETLGEHETRVTFAINLEFQSAFFNKPFEKVVEFIYSQIIECFAQEAYKRFSSK